MKYCEFCGKEIEDNTLCTCEEAVKQQEAKKNESGEYRPEKNADYGAMFKKYKIPIIAVIVAFIALVVFSTIKIEASKLDPFDYTEVTFSGYDTNGTMTVDFNREQLIEDLIGSEPTDIDDIQLWLEEYEALYDGIQYKCSHEEGLSNGEIVKISFRISEEYTDKISIKEKEYTVEGLREIKTVDVFSQIELEYTGVEGNATASIKKLSNETILNYCEFSIGENYELSSGDTITVSITNIDELATEYGYIPAPASKEFSVPALADYVKNTDQLPLSTIKSIADKYVAEKNAGLEDDFLFSYGDAKYYKTYFCVKKDDVFAPNNILRIYVCYDEYLEGAFHRTIYAPIEFKNIMISAEGNVELNYEDGGVASFSTDMTTTIDDLKDTYDVVEVNVK